MNTSILRPAVAVPALLVAALAAHPSPAQQMFRSYPANLPPVADMFTTSAALQDVDGDGDLDVLLGGAGPSGNLLLMRNDGTGRFVLDPTASRFLRGAAASLGAGDLDGDGDVDLVATGVGVALANDGTGAFRIYSSGLSPLSLGDAVDIEVADLDNDGDLDVVVPRQIAPNALYLNDGTGRFIDATARLTPDNQLTDTVATGDVDGDGDRDIVFCGRRSGRPGMSPRGEIKLHLNDGTGHFVDVSASQVPAVDMDATCSALADLDGDGDLDLVIGDANGPRRLMCNDGRGTFVDCSDRLPAAPHGPTLTVSPADLDEDGDLDLVFGDPTGSRVLRNDGGGRFDDVPAGALPQGSGGVQDASVGDVDFDGDVDVLFANAHPFGIGLPNEVWANQFRHVDAAEEPHIGERFTFAIGHRPQASTTFGVGIPIVAGARARIPVPPLGVLGLDPRSLIQLDPVYLSPTAGHTPSGVNVPRMPSLVGVEVSFQVVIVEPLRSARLTNVWSAVVRDARM